MLTIFLAFVNLYMKIAVKAPNIQRRLRPTVFLNTPFAAYLGVYLLLSALAYVFFFEDIEGPWLLPVAAAALLGIGVGNADIKFGGFSLLPLADFLQGLEAVAQAGISTQVQELDIAKRASLRDRLAATVHVSVLERECRLQGVEQEHLEKLRDLAGVSESTFAALLAREIVVKSELNAQRLIRLPTVARYPIVVDEEKRPAAEGAGHVRKAPHVPRPHGDADEPHQGAEHRGEAGTVGG